MNRSGVVIADEQVLYTEGLKCLIQDNFDDLYINDISTSGPELMDHVRTYRPDLIILNVRLPIVDGLSLIPEIKSLRPQAKILVISEYDHPKFIKTAFQGGVDGYILKSNDLQELLRCVADVMNGMTYMGEGVSIGPLHRKQGNQYETDWDMEDAFMIKSNLTKRELEILSRIADAKNNKEIAQELYISDQTVGVHRKNIMKKLNLSTTASLIKMAHDFGIVTS